MTDHHRRAQCLERLPRRPRPSHDARHPLRRLRPGQCMALPPWTRPRGNSSLLSGARCRRP